MGGVSAASPPGVPPAPPAEEDPEEFPAVLSPFITTGGLSGAVGAPWGASSLVLVAPGAGATTADADAMGAPGPMRGRVGAITLPEVAGAVGSGALIVLSGATCTAAPAAVGRIAGSRDRSPSAWSASPGMGMVAAASSGTGMPGDGWPLAGKGATFGSALSAGSGVGRGEGAGCCSRLVSAVSGA